MRAKDQLGVSGFEGMRGNGCWFFPSNGSGIFIDTGRTLHVADRSIVTNAANWRSIPHNVSTMAHAKLAVARFRPNKEKFPSIAYTLGIDTVLIGGTRSHNLGHPELVVTSSACILPDQAVRTCVPLQTSFGWRGSGACSCDDRSPALNCENTSMRNYEVV